MDNSTIFGIVVAIVVLLVAFFRRPGRAAGESPIAAVQREMKERTEALFRATFPELQPHFHPARVHEYVKARIARKAASGPTSWKNPPGFPAAAAAEIELDGLRDRVRLLDAAGVALADFVYEEHPEGAVLRVGKGKFTVNTKGPEPRVRYWHPQREFKWTPRSWKLSTGMADQPIERGENGTTFASDTSSSSSSSSSSFSRAAAAGAGIAAAGGTFDGGGASASWDDSSGGSSSSGGDSSPDFSSVESGSSSSDSTSFDSSDSSGTSTSY